VLTWICQRYRGLSAISRENEEHCPGPWNLRTRAEPSTVLCSNMSESRNIRANVPNVLGFRFSCWFQLLHEVVFRGPRFYIRIILNGAAPSSKC
jgi:hypothetical protein